MLVTGMNLHLLLGLLLSLLLSIGWVIGASSDSGMGGTQACFPLELGRLSLCAVPVRQQRVQHLLLLGKVISVGRIWP